MRYVYLPANAVDTALLEDATRRGQPNPANLIFLEAIANRVGFHGYIEASNAAAAKTR